MISLIAVVARNRAIGLNQKLLWHLPEDMRHFRAMTHGKPVIMGRKTWESLPKKPLPGRLNIVITRQKNYRAEGAVVVADGPSALKAAGAVEEICVIGGGEIFDMFLTQTDRIYLTEVDLEVDGDTFFTPLDPAQWTETAREIHPQGPNDSAGFVLRVLDRNA